MTEQPTPQPDTQDELEAGITRPPTRATPDGQLAWESTVTAPTEWVPYVYTEAELRQVEAKRSFSITSLAVGVAGVLVGLFAIWGAPLSALAIVFALAAAAVEPRARSVWLPGLAFGVVGLAIGVGWLVYILTAAPGRGS